MITGAIIHIVAMFSVKCYVWSEDNDWLDQINLFFDKFINQAYKNTGSKFRFGAYYRDYKV